jgi:hypothetical protein
MSTGLNPVDRRSTDFAPATTGNADSIAARNDNLTTLGTKVTEGSSLPLLGAMLARRENVNDSRDVF